MPFYKNVVSQKIPVYAFDQLTGLPATGEAANITAEISKDGGASAATNDANPTEIDATDHPGWYLFDMTQTEMNADLIHLTAVCSSTSILVDPAVIHTMPGSNAGVLADLVDAPNTTALSAISAAIEAAILDEGDATALLAAISAKVEEFLINEGDSTATLAAIATAIRTELTTELARIDATISSRSTYAGSDTPGTTTLLSRLTATRAGYLDTINDLADGQRLDLLIDFLVDMAEADEYVVTSTTPWQIAYMKKGTGAPGVGTELYRKNVKSTAGADLTAESTVVGQLVEPA